MALSEMAKGFRMGGVMPGVAKFSTPGRSRDRYPNAMLYSISKAAATSRRTADAERGSCRREFDERERREGRVREAR